MIADNCKARRYGDQMMCECGLAWDVDDSEPPVCGSESRRQEARCMAMDEMRELLSDD